MLNFLEYLFYPNPGQAAYGDPAIMGLLALGAGLIILGIVIKVWRGRITNGVTKKLTRSWFSLCVWFGVIELVLVVSRVERIQFVGMRFMLVLWALALVLAALLQWRMFRMKHYEVLPRAGKTDPRDQYLPGKKR